MTDITASTTIQDEATGAELQDPAVPYRAGVTHSVAAVVPLAEALAPGGVASAGAVVAGRIVARRRNGGLLFADLQDRSGRIQIMADAAGLVSFEQLARRRIGDWIIVTGRPSRTRRGEPSVHVDAWELAAASRLPFPDQVSGLTDADQRWRQRYVDLWVNPDARRILELRSRLVSLLRRYLEDRGFMEVETPILQPQHGGANARPFVTHHNALDSDLSLRIAPELYLKRLVVGGFERIFEVGRAFRNEGISNRHNPEFTLLEIYQAFADYTDMMALTEGLVAHLATELLGTTSVVWQGHTLELAAPWRRATMRGMVAEATGVDIGPHLDERQVAALAHQLRLVVDPAWGWGRVLAEAFEDRVERSIVQPTFVCDHPVEISPLARRHRTAEGMTERFEVIVAGRELCNAFSELVDPVDQLDRFLDQAGLRDAGDDQAMGVDLDYVRALGYGLPPTGGLGIGIDRLVMLLTDTANVREVIAFPTLRPLPDEPARWVSKLTDQ